ncbi:MAG: glycosyltransferase [Acidobacteriales bacterium]|nr:glycosyltransferase [Terriglobales bacterium]
MQAPKPLHIAILGSRGIPNRYGGFEAFAEKLSEHLVRNGYRVSVYCRRQFSRPEDAEVVDQRIRRVVLPSITSKHLDTPVHTFLSILHVIFTDADLVLMVNVANSLFAWMPRLVGKPVVLNVDGLDRKRKKWRWFARGVLYICELISLFTPTRVVTDARAIQDYYRQRYGKRSTMIAYGADPPRASSANHELGSRGLKAENYILYVSRMEPENNPELVLRAYQMLKTDWPLVMVGGNSYDATYDAKLRSIAAQNVIFTGPVYGDGYWALQKNAGMFIFACEVGGVHPALIEAMAAGRAVLYLDTDSNRETANGCGTMFGREPDDLARKINELINDPARRSRLGEVAAEFARQQYSWDKIARQYEELFLELRPDIANSTVSRKAEL